MIHQRQGLAFSLEARHHTAGVHPQLDDLQRDTPSDRLRLLGDIDDAAAAFAQPFEQFVGADPITG